MRWLVVLLLIAITLFAICWLWFNDDEDIPNDVQCDRDAVFTEVSSPNTKTGNISNHRWTYAEQLLFAQIFAEFEDDVSELSSFEDAEDQKPKHKQQMRDSREDETEEKLFEKWFEHQVMNVEYDSAKYSSLERQRDAHRYLNDATKFLSWARSTPGQYANARRALDRFLAQEKEANKTIKAKSKAARRKLDQERARAKAKAKAKAKAARRKLHQERARAKAKTEGFICTVHDGMRWVFTQCTNIEDLKHQIEDRLGLHSSLWFLSCGGHIVGGTDKISNLHGCHIELHFRMRGGAGDEQKKEQKEKPNARRRYEYNPEDFATSSQASLANSTQREASVESSVATTAPLTQDSYTLGASSSIQDILVQMKRALAFEKFGEFSTLREDFITKVEAVHQHESDVSWINLKQEIALENVNSHAVSVWMDAENDPFLHQVSLRDWPGKAEVVKVSCCDVDCRVDRRTFRTAGLTSSQWLLALNWLCDQCEIDRGKSYDIVVGFTTLSKLKSCSKLQFINRFPRSCSAVQIRLLINDNDDTFRMEIHAESGWAAGVVDAIFEIAWHDERLRKSLLSMMSTNLFGGTDGLRFIVLSQWRLTHMEDAATLELGDESSESAEIDRQCREIKRKFPHSYHNTLFEMMVNFFDVKGAETIDRDIDRYRKLLRSVPNVQHKPFYPFPLTKHELDKLKVTEPIDFRRGDGKWVVADVVENDADKGTIRISFECLAGNTVQKDMSRHVLHTSGRVRGAGLITSRGIHRAEMGFVCDQVSARRGAIYVSVRVPSFFDRLSSFREPREMTNDWHRAQVVERDSASAQIFVTFDSALWVHQMDERIPALWVHLDDVCEVGPINSGETAAVCARETIYQAEMQHECDSCPAMDERAADETCATSHSGFLVMRRDVVSCEWVDIAIPGSANPLYRMLLGIKRDYDFSLGSPRSSKKLYLRFNSTGTIDLRFTANVLDGHVTEDPLQEITKRCLIAPISARVRKLNLSLSADTETNYVMQLHCNTHAAEFGWLRLTRAEELDGFVLFGQEQDHDLLRTRVGTHCVYKLQQRPGNTIHVMVSRCLGTMKCCSRSCSQFTHICRVPQPESRKKRPANWDLCKKCQQPMLLSNCSSYVFDFKQCGAVLRDSRFARIVVAFGEHHEDCGVADFHSRTKAGHAFLSRRLSWSDWDMRPSKLAVRLFQSSQDPSQGPTQPFTIGQLDGWYTGSHLPEAMRTARRQHMRELGVTRRDILLFDEHGIPEQLRDVVQYVDTSTETKVIVLWDSRSVEFIARDIQNKRCCFFEDPEFIATQIESQPELVDIVMPLVGMKDATFRLLRGEELKLIDSVIWNNRCKKFVYFSFCITNNESVGAYFVSFLLELLEIRKYVGSLRKIAQSLRFIFDLCNKCRVGFNVAWAVLNLHEKEVLEARRNNKLCELYNTYAPENLRLQGWTEQWFGMARIPYTIQPDKVHVDRLFHNLKRFIPSDRKNAFMESAFKLVSARDLKDGLRALNEFVEEWRDVSTFRTRCELLMNPYYIRHVFHWGKNVRASDILQYKAYPNSNPIESLHNYEKVAAGKSRLNVLACIELIMGMLKKQSSAQFGAGKLHQHGVHRNQMRESAAKGVSEFLNHDKPGRSSFASGRLDRCRRRNVANARCLYKLDMNERAGNAKGLHCKIYVYGWKNNLYSAESQFNVATLGLLYPGINSRSKKSSLDKGYGFLGKFVAVVEHWNGHASSRVLTSLTQFLLDKSTHTNKHCERMTRSMWESHHASLCRLKSRETITKNMLTMFDCRDMREFQSRTLEDLLQEDEWETFTRQNRVHWIGDSMDGCWDRVVRFETNEHFKDMAMRLANKEFDHTYIVFLKRDDIADYFLFKLTHIESKLVCCWYTQFANQEAIKGKKRAKEEKKGIWKTLHAVERDVAIALFWHAGVHRRDEELWALLEEIELLWKAFEMHSSAFVKLCCAKNAKTFATLMDDEILSIDTAADAWKVISKKPEMRAECLDWLTTYARDKFDSVEEGLRNSSFAYQTHIPLRRVVGLWKEHARHNPVLWVENKAMLITLRHRLEEIQQVVREQKSRLLGDVIRHGVMRLELNHAVSVETRKERRRFEHQLSEPLALAGDQLRDLRCVEVMESQSCFGNQAFTSTVNVEGPLFQPTQISKNKRKPSTAELLELVIRTQEEIERGVQHSQFVCFECVRVEEEHEQYVQCSKCPMKLHLKCADIDVRQWNYASHLRLRWVCFACLGLVQINFTTSVNRNHETVAYPRKHRTSRNHLLQKVNRIGGRFVCALELREPTSFMIYLALWLKPIRTKLCQRHIFQHFQSDAFMLGTILERMLDKSFIPREELTIVMKSIPDRLGLISLIKLLIDAFASVCETRAEHLNCSIVRFKDLNTAKHVSANLTVIYDIPKLSSKSQEGAETDESTNLMSLEGQGELRMIITPQMSCLLLCGEDEEDQDNVFEVSRNMVVRRRTRSFCQPFAEGCFFFYFQEHTTAEVPESGQRVNVQIEDAAAFTSARVRPFAEVAAARLDQTKYIVSALDHGHISRSWIGANDLVTYAGRRRELVRRRCKAHIEMRGGRIEPCIGDGNCLIRAFALYQGHNWEVKSTVENEASGRLTASTTALFQLRQDVCNMYFRRIESGDIQDPREDERAECRNNRAHLSLDFVYAYHLETQTNVYVVSYNDTFDDLDVDAFSDTRWIERPPMFILSSPRHYDFVRFCDPVQTIRRLTQEVYEYSPEVSRAFGYRSYRCYALPPLRNKWAALENVDSQVWSWIMNGLVIDNTRLGRLCQRHDPHKLVSISAPCQLMDIARVSDEADLDVWLTGKEGQTECDIGQGAGRGVSPELEQKQEERRVCKKAFSIMLAECTAAERDTVCGYLRELETAANVDRRRSCFRVCRCPTEIVEVVLKQYYRRVSEWERSASNVMIGSLANYRRLHKRPALGDELLLREHYAAAARLNAPMLCVMRFYYKSKMMGLGVEIDDGPQCCRVAGAIKCQNCDIRIHVECSITPVSPLCPWCIQDIPGIFQRTTHDVQMKGGCTLPMRDCIPLDLPEMEVAQRVPKRKESVRYAWEEMGNGRPESLNRLLNDSDNEDIVTEAWWKQCKPYRRPDESGPPSKRRRRNDSVVERTPTSMSIASNQSDVADADDTAEDDEAEKEEEEEEEEEDEVAADVVLDLSMYAANAPPRRRVRTVIEDMSQDSNGVALNEYEESMRVLAAMAKRRWKAQRQARGAANALIGTGSAIRSMVSVLELLLEVNTLFGDEALKRMLRATSLVTEWFWMFTAAKVDKEMAKLVQPYRKILWALVNFYPQFSNMDPAVQKYVHPVLARPEFRIEVAGTKRSLEDAQQPAAKKAKGDKPEAGDKEGEGDKEED